MTAIPKIETYRSDDAPADERWISQFRTRGPLPLIFRGATKEYVIAAARAWWTAEVAKEAKRKEQAAAMAERRRVA